MAPSRKAAEKALELASKKYGAKYPKAIECLEKDREELLAFYDFCGALAAHPDDESDRTYVCDVIASS